MEYNKLDLLKERQLDFFPLHFSLFPIDDKIIYTEKDNILDWIRSKLAGRFALLKSVSIDSEQRLKSRFTVGFERSSELTYFMIACPFLRRP